MRAQTKRVSTRQAVAALVVSTVALGAAAVASVHLNEPPTPRCVQSWQNGTDYTCVTYIQHPDESPNRPTVVHLEPGERLADVEPDNG